jgi:hypothetical protein
VACHQTQGTIYKITSTGKCFKAISGCFGCLEMGPANYPTHLVSVTCPAPVAPVVVDWPSCKPNCYSDPTGCPGGVPCHQTQGTIYKITATGLCYKAISACYGCLEMNPAGYPDHLVAQTCPAPVVVDWPSCVPNCYTEPTGCGNGQACHQVEGTIYKITATGQCYKAISGCMGCLEMGPQNYPTHLVAQTCPVTPKTTTLFADTFACDNSHSIAQNTLYQASQGTYSFWINTPSPTACGSGNTGAILLDLRTEVGDVIVLGSDGKVLHQSTWASASVSNIFYASSPLSNNAWHHIAFVFDTAAGAACTLYVDGVQVGSQANNHDWTWPLRPIEVGWSHDPYWFKYSGRLTDIQFFDIKLTATSISSINAAGHA